MAVGDAFEGDDWVPGYGMTFASALRSPIPAWKHRAWANEAAAEPESVKALCRDDRNDLTR